MSVEHHVIVMISAKADAIAATAPSNCQRWRAEPIQLKTRCQRYYCSPFVHFHSFIFNNSLSFPGLRRLEPCVQHKSDTQNSHLWTISMPFIVRFLSLKCLLRRAQHEVYGLIFPKALILRTIPAFPVSLIICMNVFELNNCKGTKGWSQRSFFPLLISPGWLTKQQLETV